MTVGNRILSHKISYRGWWKHAYTWVYSPSTVLVPTMADSGRYESFSGRPRLTQGRSTAYDTYVSLGILMVVFVNASLPYVVRGIKLLQLRINGL
jgi:hypothetical protein